MDNSMQNMLEMYIFETNSLIEQLDGILLDAEKEDSFSEDSINEIFRIMHTIKGSSAMMEFDSLKTVAHKIEDLFFYIRDKGMTHEHSRDLFNLLFTASDFMKEEIEKVQNDETLTQDMTPMVDKIQEVLKLISESSAGGASTAATEKAEPKSAEESGGEVANKSLPIFDDKHKHGITVYLDEGLGMENLRAFMLVEIVNEVCEDFRFYPEDVETNAEASAYIIDNGFTFALQSEEEQNIASEALMSAINVRSCESFVGESSAAAAQSPAKAETVEAEVKEEKVETPVEAAKEVPAPEKKEETKKQDVKKENASNKQSLISVNLSKLDTLMDIVGEVVITESMVTSNPDIANLKSESFAKAARQLRKLTDDLQDTAMSLRMVPVSGTFQKMNRIVRDMSQKLNKDVRLVTVGADTEVDKTIVDSIGDPIMHMVRNSMDHGIEENSNDRIERGKPRQGTITLSAQHTGSEIVISISDDGKGVNSEKVLAKAKKNGLLTKPESEYSRREILNMLLMPGFSTNTNVTEFSGRGVGMDVVKKNLEKVGGTITMTSEEGEGMTTTMKIPLTLAIVDGMQVTVGDLMFTIPISNIRQSFKVKEEELIYDEARGVMIQKEEGFYPLVRLSDFYDIETDIENVEDGTIMWLDSGDKVFCLFVDKLLGKQQVVVKALPPFLKEYDVKNYGISGCTILGDGNISIILDPVNMYDAAVTEM